MIEVGSLVLDLDSLQESEFIFWQFEDATKIELKDGFVDHAKVSRSSFKDDWDWSMIALPDAHELLDICLVVFKLAL